MHITAFRQLIQRIQLYDRMEKMELKLSNDPIALKDKTERTALKPTTHRNAAPEKMAPKAP